MAASIKTINLGDAMRRAERIRDLSAQLVRAEHPAAIELVLGELKLAIADYERERELERDTLVVQFPLASESAA